MARFCSSCGAQLPENSTSCPSCNAPGAPVTGPAPAPGAPPVSPTTSGGLTNNVAGALAYLLLPAIIFLIMEPYNRNKFIRFHSLQSIFFTVAYVIVQMVLRMFRGLGWALSGLVGFAAFILWIVLLVKASQGQMWKLPIIGDLAEKQAGS
jgi:uncharacterized membrane protein